MEFTATTIAQLINGTVDGNPQATVSTFAKIEEGHPGAISFLANPKYTHYIYQTHSSVVLVSNDFVAEHPIRATLIRVANPYEAVSELMTIAQRMMAQAPSGIEQPCYVSPSATLGKDVYVGAFAYIGDGAVLEEGAKIYPHCYVGRGVKIGAGSILYSGVKVYDGCKIGNRCILHSGAVIGADGFGFAPTADGSYNKIPQMGIVEIEDDVEIGANTTIDRATMGATHIGHGTKLDNLIQIAHNVQLGHDNVFAAQTGVAGSTKIGSNCVFAGQVGFAGHITVGDRVTIGAQSGVPNNVPDGVTLMGYPAIKSSDFLRQTACMRRLRSLFDDVDQLKKEIKH